MSDIIHLLSDLVANQIAAGEVVQRPASVVKELIENAIDAEAKQIQLIVKDTGKTLIQVVDNGKGMSFNDARLCFERHATSKINNTDDLQKLTTKGFRGEALASIVAIAHVEMKTKQADSITGTQIIIEGSEIKEHTPTVTQSGTSIAVKNLFFNVPVRRNFLKTDAVEMGYIEEEFYRAALIHTDIEFILFHNGKLLFQLPPSNFKQRIINIFGSYFKEKLFPIEQVTDQIKISGFITKPENAKKRKNEQYLFINQRFVRHYLLTHAIESAYTDLIPQGYKPGFFIQIELDPATVDININPTKIEIKLQDERLVYGFLHATVKKSLGMLTLTPQIDFDCEPGLDVSMIKDKEQIKSPQLTLNPNYNPFKSNSSGSNSTHKNENSFGQWDKFLTELKNESAQPLQKYSIEQQQIPLNTHPSSLPSDDSYPSFLFSNRYIVTNIFEKIAIIDIHSARERILFEHYMEALLTTPVVIQQTLFPETVTFLPAAAELVLELKDELRLLGYELEQIDRSSFAVNGMPTDEEEGDIQNIISTLIENYRSHQFLHKDDKNKNIATGLAKQKRSMYKPFSTDLEQKTFIRQLLNTQIPYLSPSGKKTIYFIDNENIDKL